MKAPFARAKGLALWLTAGSLAVSGCASGAYSLPATSLQRDARGTRITVTNNHWLDSNIYAMRGGFRYRLGTVPALSTRRLLIPRSVGDAGTELRLLADPVGSAVTHLSEPVVVPNTGTIRWDIHATLRFSAVSIRY